MSPTSSDFEACAASQRPRWSNCITTVGQRTRGVAASHTIGVLPGEGIGPEVVEASLAVLTAVAEVRSVVFNLLIGGATGSRAMAVSGKPLSSEVMRFCEEVFACGGAILAGAAGDRFVYEMRHEFDLFCKLNPVAPHPAVRRCAAVKASLLADVDIMVVRDNSAGVYQGHWSESASAESGRRASHSFAYDESQVRRLVHVGAAIALKRRGKMTLVLKPGGVPTISQLWLDCAVSIAEERGVKLELAEIDFAAYQLVQSPADLDVIVAPNLFGDILADLGGVLLGSRGLCYGASFSPNGAAVYQTNHGAAIDLAGTNQANPVAQILALSMLLHESWGLSREAELIETAIADVWSSGYRTFDVMEVGCELVGTREMTELIVKAIHKLGKG